MANRETFKKSPPAMPAGPDQFIAGDSNWIKLRDKTTGGTISNSQVLADGLITDGTIYVANVPAIGIACDLTLGSLSNVNVVPEVADAAESTWTRVSKIAGSTSSASHLWYILAADGPVTWIMQNPGATWIRFKVYSTGTVTGSGISLWASRIHADLRQPRY